MQHKTFNWKSFKDISFHIESQKFFQEQDNNVEAWKRIFISRLYYFVFHNSVEVAENISKHIKDSSLKFEYDIYNAHGHIRNFYKNISSKYPLPKNIKYDFYNVSNELLELHKMRKEADYNIKINEEDLAFFCDKSKEYSISTPLLLDKITNYFDTKFGNNK